VWAKWVIECAPVLEWESAKRESGSGPVWASAWPWLSAQSEFFSQVEWQLRQDCAPETVTVRGACEELPAASFQE
jgi:hypothetical protein